MSRYVTFRDHNAIEDIASMEECRHLIDSICCCEGCRHEGTEVSQDECDRCPYFREEDGIMKILYNTSELRCSHI